MEGGLKTLQRSVFPRRPARKRANPDQVCTSLSFEEPKKTPKSYSFFNLLVNVPQVSFNIVKKNIDFPDGRDYTLFE